MSTNIKDVIAELDRISALVTRFCDIGDEIDELKETVKYIKTVLSRITLVGAVFICIIAGLPIAFSKLTSLPTSVSIGGTGLLIVVGVALETYKQLEGSILTRSYKRGYSRR